MKVPGKRSTRTRWIHGDQLVVKVNVEVVFPEDDPTDACYEPETVRFLEEVRRHADAGDVPWLTTVGTVYQRIAATAV